MLREQLGDRLSVELDTAPTVDLNKVLDEMRCQYERVLANNRRDAEEWFAAQVSAHPKGRASGREQVPTGKGRLPGGSLARQSNRACVSDRRAEPSADVQCRAAAGMPV